MNDHDMLINLLKNNISDMQDAIDSLYVTCNSCTKKCC
jgi:hypothetical protein